MEDAESPGGDAIDAAPGWDAIDAALAPLYASVAPKHYGPIVPSFLGGSDPLQGISAYQRTDPVPHWHFITYGFSELFAKESKDPAVSGWGFELTFRLACDPQAETPPVWALNFLQNMGRYVFKSGNAFAAGHYMNLNGPIALGTETAIRAIAFLRDPELPPINTPHGRVEFLQVVGITLDEQLALKQWSTLKALAVLGQHLPLMVTDLARASLLHRPSVTAALAEGAGRDRSSTDLLFVERLGWQKRDALPGGAAYTLVIGANQIIELQALLPYRLPYGRELRLVGREERILLTPGAAVTVTESEGTLGVALDAAAQAVFRDQVKPRVGTYRLCAEPELVLEVRKTEIRNPEGEVIETIG
jgi:suppressor of fused